MNSKIKIYIRKEKSKKYKIEEFIFVWRDLRYDKHIKSQGG